MTTTEIHKRNRTNKYLHLFSTTKDIADKERYYRLRDLARQDLCAFMFYNVIG